MCKILNLTGSLNYTYFDWTILSAEWSTSKKLEKKEILYRSQR